MNRQGKGDIINIRMKVWVLAIILLVIAIVWPLYIHDILPIAAFPVILKASPDNLTFTFDIIANNTSNKEEVRTVSIKNLGPEVKDINLIAEGSPDGLINLSKFDDSINYLNKRIILPKFYIEAINDSYKNISYILNENKSSMGPVNNSATELGKNISILEENILKLKSEFEIINRTDFSLVKINSNLTDELKFLDIPKKYDNECIFIRLNPSTIEEIGEDDSSFVLCKVILYGNVTPGEYEGNILIRQLNNPKNLANPIPVKVIVNYIDLKI